MRGWNDLPPETKQHVVQNLDLMGRLALRSTCRRDRAIVDSTKFYIPRVRIAVRDPGKECLMVIYTGIEKFLRLEFVMEKKKVKVHRSENYLDPRAISTKTLPDCDDPSLALLQIFFQIFIAKNLATIGTMELENVHYSTWFFGFLTVAIQNLGDSFDERYLEAACRIRARKIVFHKMKTRRLIRKFFDRKILESQESEEVIVDEEWAAPGVIFEHQVRLENLVPITHRKICLSVCRHNDDERYLPDSNHNGEKCKVYTTTRHVRDGELAPNLKDSKEKLNEQVTMKREVGPKIVDRHMESKCGAKWTHNMEKDQEKYFVKEFKTETCGLGDYCQKCADPFDYWYSTQMCRRMLSEPNWCHVFRNPRNLQHKPLFVQCNMEWQKTHEKWNTDEKNGNQKKKSWGFRNLKPHPNKRYTAKQTPHYDPEFEADEDSPDEDLDDINDEEYEKIVKRSKGRNPKLVHIAAWILIAPIIFFILFSLCSWLFGFELAYSFV